MLAAVANLVYRPLPSIQAIMASEDLQLSVPIPHQYWVDNAVNKSITEEAERRAKALTEFRGYVVSRGFDIESVLERIIAHLLFLNRPKYIDETSDEYRFFRRCGAFVQNDLLASQLFSFH